MASKPWKELAATGNPGAATNYVGDSLPTTGDDVPFNAGSVSVSTNEDALAGVALGVVRVEKAYTGSHGDEDTPFEFDAAQLIYNGRGKFAHYYGDLPLVKIVGTGNGYVILDNDGTDVYDEIYAGAGRLTIKAGAKIGTLIVKDCAVTIEAGVTIVNPIIFVGGRGSVTTASSTAGVIGGRGRITYTGAAGDTGVVTSTGVLIDIQSAGATFADIQNYATDRGGVTIGNGSGDITFSSYTSVDGAVQDFDPANPPERVTVTAATKIDFGLVTE